jgi:hypothetical protein
LIAIVPDTGYDLRLFLTIQTICQKTQRMFP